MNPSHLCANTRSSRPGQSRSPPRYWRRRSNRRPGAWGPRNSNLLQNRRGIGTPAEKASYQFVNLSLYSQ